MAERKKDTSSTEGDLFKIRGGIPHIGVSSRITIDGYE